MGIINTASLLFFARIVLLFAVGLPLTWGTSYFAKKFVSQKISAHIAMLVGNIIFYIGLTLIGISLIQEFGFNISALLGAAGLVGIAVGFAAKTTVSNIISGIFLLLERPFVVGDRISCAGNSGIVESIDLMSVKLRTVNGQLVRIPNEILICQSMTNISFYPKRRIVFKVEIRPEENISPVLTFLQNSIESDPLFLSDPKPLVTIKGFGQYATEITIRVWVKQRDVKLVYPQLSEKTNLFGTTNNCWIGLTQE